MQHNKCCPKCNSTNIVQVKGSKYNTNHRISLDNWSMKWATLDRYICVTCGYTEEWVQFDKKLDKWADEKLKEQFDVDDDLV